LWNGETNAIFIELIQCGMETQMPYELTPSMWTGNTNAIGIEFCQRGTDTQIPYGMNSVRVE
jgi:hypothetical protein